MSLSSANRTLQMLSRLMDTEHSTETYFEMGVQKPAIETGRSTQPLPCVSPERQGISSRHIADFLRALETEPTLRMHSLLVLRNGKLLCKAAFGARDTELPRMTFSACKSVTALAVGLLMDDGLLSPEDKLTELFPHDCGPVSRRLMKDLTVHHLLTMQTGNLFNEAASMTEQHWTKGFFTSPGLETSRKFQYNSLNTYLLAVLVTRLTGMSLTDFLTKRLFAPMGIADFYWEVSPEGIEKGGWGLYLKPEDLGKLGQLVMDGGLWKGKQLISAEFISKATQTHVQVPVSYGSFNYGWQIWVGRKENVFLFNGMMGQNVLGFRDSGIILVSHAGNDEAFQTSAYYPLAQHYFGSSFPERLPVNLFSDVCLRQTIRSLKAKAGPIPSLKEFERFSNIRYEVTEPQAASAGLLPLILQTVEGCFSKGLQAISLEGTRTVPELIYEESDQVHHLRCGIRAPIRQTVHYHGNTFEASVQARFTHDENENPVLRIQIDFPETPCTRILKIMQTKQGMFLRQEETPGVDFLAGMMSNTVFSGAAKTVISAVLGSSEQGFLRWKIEKMFHQTMKLTQES